MNKEVNEERTPRTVADVKEMLTKHSNGEIQRTIQNCITILQNDDVLNKFLKTMQTTAARLQEKLLKPEVRQKGKEQVKEKTRDSVLQLLNRLQAEQAQRVPGEQHTAEKSETRGDVY